MWSRAGAGSLGAAAAAAGLALGATLAAHGPLLQVDEWLSTAWAYSPLSLDAALGLPRWAAIGGVSVVIVLVLVGRRDVTRPHGSWPWPVTGLALGVVGVLAWVTGSFAGWGWGLSITGPSRSVVESTLLGRPDAAGWGTAMVLGVPLGTWLSARGRGPVAWRRPTWPATGRRFAGGLLMEIGGTLAAGCNIGNALTGLAVLALNSVIATAAIAGGAAFAILGIRGTVGGFKVVRDKR